MKTPVLNLDGVYQYFSPKLKSLQINDSMVIRCFLPTEEVTGVNPVPPMFYHQLGGRQGALSHGKSGWLRCWNHIPDVIFLGMD